jgi:hypothetical protein
MNLRSANFQSDACFSSENRSNIQRQKIFEVFQQAHRTYDPIFTSSLLKSITQLMQQV